MIALIDGDLVAFRCAASAESDGEEIAFLRCSNLMQEILNAVGATEYRLFLSGSNNFRKQIDPEYKANRKDRPLPTHLNACREYLVVSWNAEVTDTIEADDALGIAQDKVSGTTTVCSLDKDLLQIPGNHYQWPISTKTWSKEGKLFTISPIEGLRNLYKSSLIGDRADNIIGVAGLGPVKSEKVVSGCETEQELFDKCRELYSDDERFFRNLSLLHILREEGAFFDHTRFQ